MNKPSKSGFLVVILPESLYCIQGSDYCPRHFSRHLAKARPSVIIIAYLAMYKKYPMRLARESGERLPLAMLAGPLHFRSYID